MERPSLSTEQRAKPFPRQINTTDASPEMWKLHGADIKSNVGATNVRGRVIFRAANDLRSCSSFS